MLPSPFFAALNGLLAAQTAARGHLARHAGKTVCIRLAGLPLSARIADGGSFEAAGDGAPPDTDILLTPGLLLRLVAGERQALNEAGVLGDGLLAADFSRALDAVDLAQMLQPFMGDVLAARVADGLSAFQSWRQAAGTSAAKSLAEYLVHESPTLAGREAVAAFVREVDALRDAAARLEARIALLENPER